MRSIPTLALALALALPLTACGGETEDQPAQDAPATVALPAELGLSAAPEGAITVATAKAEAMGGAEIVVRGRVGGLPNPFVDGRAVMTLADDEAMTACDKKEGDACAAPWDYCCETPEIIAANTLTVQVVGEDGRPLKAGLEGFAGLAPGSMLVVKGAVADRPDPSVLIVNATGLFVEP